MKTENQFWKFFASVKLAQTVLGTLAVTSIIGTIIPQRETPDYYIQRYKPFLANLFQVLDIPDMYSSWWFTGLLAVLCLSLIICSIDRFPFAWKQVISKPSEATLARIQQMPLSRTWTSISNSQSLLVFFRTLLSKNGWKLFESKQNSHFILASQKTAWSRLGVYIVHSAILVIFVGALIGQVFGFKGNISIPETEKTGKIFLRNAKSTQDLGFEVRCDAFSVDFYDSGMPKDYISKLTIIEDGKEILSRNIEVNSPLQYKGITFYQASYEPYRDFIVNITNLKTNQSHKFVVPFQQQEEWREENLHFGIVNVDAQDNRVLRAKLWFKVGKEQPVLSMLDTGKDVDLEVEDSRYRVSVKQMYATGLQVAKDPGVWLVYIGCVMMILGLYVAFFLSHRRIYLVLNDQDGRCLVRLYGTANKNRIGFEKDFAQLAAKLDNLLTTK